MSIVTAACIWYTKENEVMDMLGCKTVADLMKVDVEKFMEASALILLRMGPERDGNYLPLNPYGDYQVRCIKQ